jgi:hypothetical protein
VNRTPAIIGFLVAGAVILGAGFLAGLRDGSSTAGAPPLHVLAPVDGDTVSNPIVIEFATPAPLRLGTAGWMADDMHLHIMVGDVEHMPAAADLAARDATFTWRLPPLPEGSHRIHLTWAGPHHRNLTGATDTLILHVRP